MTTKFEKLLDYIVNEEMEKANELFHEIVVEKSRDIYENLIAQEAEEEDMDESAEEEDVEEGTEEEDMDESAEEEDVEEGAEEEDMEEGMHDEEGMEMETAYSMDEEGDDEMHTSGDATDDLAPEVGAEDGAKEIAQDIDDNMEELQSLWQELSAKLGVEGGEDEFGGDEAGDDMGGMDDVGADDEEQEGMGFMEGRRLTREYVENVGTNWDKGSTQKAQGQYAGAGTGEKDGSPVEGKSPIANLKKPSVGDTSTKNIAQSKSEAAPDGTTPHGKAGGFLSNPKEDNAGNGNVPGGKMGVKNLKKVAGGHGAEKKGSGPGPVGSGSGDKAGQTSMGNTSSILKPLK